MKRATRKKIGSLIASTVLIMLASKNVATAPPPVLPNPVLYMMGSEFFQTGTKSFTRYVFDVLNKNDYPAEIFAAAPNLPPCGTNTKSSRTWVDFYDQRGKRLYGFCALPNPDKLTGIWFAVETDVVPPSYVYIEMTDRQTGTKYRSNLADTTL